MSIQNVFDKFYCKTRNANINFILIGSYRLYLEDSRVIPEDIDIVVSMDRLLDITQIFKENVVQKPKYSELSTLRSTYSRIEINGISIDLISEMEVKIEGFWRKFVTNSELTSVEVAGNRISSLNLHYELSVAKSLGNVTKSRTIQEVISRRTTTNAKTP